MTTTLQHDRYLCPRTGKQLIVQGDSPSLFALHEHQVGDHGGAIRPNRFFIRRREV
jgi:hypothetical protein